MTNSNRIRGARLRGFAERTFDRETLERVILPAIADLQHECGAADAASLAQRMVVLRAYWGLWKTIGMCVIGDVAHNRDGIASSLGVRTFVFLVIVLAALMTSYASWMVAFASKYGAAAALTAGAYLLPSNILVALPVAFFFALAMFRARADIPSARLLSNAAVGTLACAVVVFV